jgi:phage shock protein C
MKLSLNSRIIFGVCGGIGEKYGIDPIFIRLLFVFAFLWFGAGLLLYVLLALLME